MEAPLHHAEYANGDGAAPLLRNPPRHNLPSAQQSTHFDESHVVPRQQYAYIAAQGTSRIHAGNSYVEQQHNYYSPEAAPGNPASTSMSLQTALAFPEMHSRLANVATAQDKTCEWVFETPEFKRWLDPVFRPAHHGIIWIKGKPGAGKSTIMKHIVCTSQKKGGTGRFISFFFNARDQGLARSTEGLYRALLHSVVDSVPSLHDMVDPPARPIFKDQGWPLELLKDMFREAVRRYPHEETLTCCIDALDECDEDEVRDMLQLFEDLGEMATSEDLPFSVCLTSRHYPKIAITHTEEIVMDNHLGHHDDISEYVYRRLRLPYLGMMLKEELAAEVRKRSSGVFLWVVLVIGIINKTGDRGNIHLLRDRLWEIPANLQELFDNIIEREDPDAGFLPIIQWMLYARRPLTATELYSAVMISTDSLTEKTTQLDADVVNERVLRNFITTSSKGFLEVVAGPEIAFSARGLAVQFIHESVREFFLKYGLQRLDESVGAHGLSVAEASHQQLVRWCLSYMRLSLSQHLSSITSSTLPPVKSLLDPSRLESIPLLTYALAYGACYHSRGDKQNGLACDHIPEGLQPIWNPPNRYREINPSRAQWPTQMTHWPEVQFWMEKAGGFLLQNAPETPLSVHRYDIIQLQTPGDDLHAVRSEILDVLLAVTTSRGPCKPDPEVHLLEDVGICHLEALDVPEQ
jgi:hypothetical protein